MYLLLSFQKFNPEIYLGPAYPLTPFHSSSPTTPDLPTTLRLQMELPERNVHNEHT